jgi:cytosine/adenosine deaminase-related metal-dependent hydrolase
MRTLLHGGDVVAYADGGHRLLRGGSLVLDGDRVAFVGREYRGAVDQRVDVSGQLVIPGLINLHCHADTEAGGRLIADSGRRDYFQTGFMNYFAAPRGTKSMGVRADRVRGARFAFVEMLKSGCTTVVPIGPADDTMIETIGALGLRAYVSPAYKSGTYVLDADGVLGYDWDEAEGRRGLDRAKDFIRRHAGAHGDRVRGMLFPMQIDTCSADLLRATRVAANELRVGIEIHAGQNLLEFHEILRRHRMTPVELLEDTGLLGPDAIIGHCIISTAHHLAALPAGRDLEILVRTGTTVAHCPLVFARRGNALESFHRFRAAGVNVALGTDTYPRDLISEMRWATLLSKIVERDFTVATAADALFAATLAGAKALGRDDLGRLAPGAKADVVVIDMRKIRIGPYRDPIKAFVNCATTDDVERVWVDGRLVVDGGRVVGVDEAALLREAQIESESLWAQVAEWHWEKKTADEMAPPSLPTLDRDLGGAQ